VPKRVSLGLRGAHGLGLQRLWAWSWGGWCKAWLFFAASAFPLDADGLNHWFSNLAALGNHMESLTKF
jgi:hypothetical protein